MIVKAFFKATLLSLALAASFPEHKVYKNKLKGIFLYKVWPLVFIVIWIPMVIMVLMKILQHINNKDWDNFLDVIHMFFLGCLTLYMAFAVQMTSPNMKKIIDTVLDSFYSYKYLTMKDFSAVLMLWFALLCAFPLYVGGCIYYKETLVPLWVPFTDNDKEYSIETFYFVWAYEMGACFYMALSFGIWGPFIIVSSICICHEIDLLINALYKFKNQDGYMKPYSKFDIKLKTDVRYLKSQLFSTVPGLTEVETRDFVKSLVEHHIIIKRAIEHVQRVNSYVFLVQTVVTVVHSCFLSFNMYYTSQLEKVVAKSSPILFTIYYLMFAYCWNGQQLTNKCDELYRAAYMCQWYDCSLTFKSSLVFMMELYKRPVHLTAGPLFPATLETFSHCVQQSISYALVLKELAPQK